MGHQPTQRAHPLILSERENGKDFSLPPLFAYMKMISLFAISLAQALMLLSRPTHSKAREQKEQ